MVKSILFKMEMNGCGVVNFDSKEQKFFMNAHCGTSYYHDNIKLAKKAFYRLPEDKVIETEMSYVDDNGNVKNEGKKKVIDMGYKLKISSDCLRNAIFGCNYPNALALYSDEIFANFITSPEILLRGFTELERGGEDNNGYVKASALRISDAIEESGAVPYLELHSKSVKKDKNTNSLFYEEKVGKTKYEVKGYINLKELQFMSDDELFGRLSFKNDWLKSNNPLFETVFKNHYGRVPYKEGYFTSVKGLLTDRFAEHGIKFDNKFIKYLVKFLLKKMMHINISRAGAYAQTSTLKIKFVEDGINDKFDSEDGWITLDDGMIDGLDFVVNDFYTESDEETVKLTGKELKNRRDELEKQKKDKKNKSKSKKTEEES